MGVGYLTKQSRKHIQLVHTVVEKSVREKKHRQAEEEEKRGEEKRNP